jgi:hypothetical protein
MARPTEKDIEVTRDGYYFLDCDGRHTPSWHKYLYYTKREVISLWREDHPRTEKKNG